ncbi:hypothetical protein FF2_012405 [Malus domestica]
MSHHGPSPHHIPGSAPPLHDIVCFGSRPRPYSFVSRNSRATSWDCSRANSLNFEVLIEPEVNELPKGLMLGRDKNIHIRFTETAPLGYVGCYNPPPLGAQCPRLHTSGQGLALISNCHIAAWVATTSQA